LRTYFRSTWAHFPEELCAMSLSSITVTKPTLHFPSHYPFWFLGPKINMMSRGPFFWYGQKTGPKKESDPLGCVLGFHLSCFLPMTFQSKQSSHSIGVFLFDQVNLKKSLHLNEENRTKRKQWKRITWSKKGHQRDEWN
jgi:hypothetical protein